MPQLQSDVERPIAFASCVLSPTEWYSVGEQEALACLWACERWHMYLYGCEFTLRTDHQAPTTLLATSGTGHKPLRLHHWAERLQQYNFCLQFTPGRDNVVAIDLLSRSIITPTPESTAPVREEVEHNIIQHLHTPLQETVSLSELQDAPVADPALSLVASYIRNGWPNNLPDNLSAYFGVREQLACWNDSCVASVFQARVLAMVPLGPSQAQTTMPGPGQRLHCFFSPAV